MISQADYNKFVNPYFNGPTGVFVDTDEGVDTIYVADNANDRVVQFKIELKLNGIFVILNRFTSHFKLGDNDLCFVGIGFLQS